MDLVFGRILLVMNCGKRNILIDIEAFMSVVCGVPLEHFCPAGSNDGRQKEGRLFHFREHRSG